MSISMTPAAMRPHLRLHGRLRFDTAGALGLSWSYSGCSFCFTGTGFAITCAPYAYPSPTYLSIEVDGVQYKLPVDQNGANGVYTTKPGAHTAVLRRCSAANGSPTLWLSAVTLTDGAFLPPPPEKGLRLEFLGDSITCGYGVLGAPGAPYRPHEEDATVNYAARIAAALNAEARFISISGQGVVRNCAGEVGNPIPRFFHCRARDSKTEDWTFDDGFQPDAVIVNAGTNDVGGKVSPDDFAAGAAALLRDIRAHYPQAKIVWYYGLMNSEMIPPLEQTVAALRQTDDAVYFLPTTRIGAHPGEAGANGHPGVRGHRRAANELLALLRDIL